MYNRDATLELFTVKNVFVEIALIAAAVILPAALHLVPGINVFALLPMHWTIFAAGLIYGYRGGLIAGLFSPVISFMLTGMPMAPVLPLMIVELGMYGFVTGILREKTALHQILILLIASVAGRIAFLGLAVILGRTANIMQFAANAFVPGLFAAVAIVIGVPFLSEGIRKLISRDSE